MGDDMKIAIGSDHNGSKFKDEIIQYLKGKGNEVIDVSVSSTLGDDYPIYAFNAGELVANKVCDIGILLCGTGIGMSIAANKVKGIRAAHVSSADEARLAKEHNDANIITLSANSNRLDDILKYIDIFMDTKFLNEERHIRRNELISKYEKGEVNV